MIVRTVALSIAMMVALTGCTIGQGSGNVEDAAKPPAGGWPQPENGKLTDKMCGLLTQADYEQLGHTSLLKLEITDHDGKVSSNFVSCLAGLGGRLSLDLQPTAEAAKVRYDIELAQHRESVIGENQKTILAESVVQGADQSWFDYGPGLPGTTPKDYVLELRRGALLASLALGNEKVKDPRATITQMAGLVLDRIRDVGKADTGTTPKVRFEVKGEGKASAISYSTLDHRGENLENVQLPWSIELAMADHGKGEVMLQLSANSPANALPLHLSCSISVRGTSVKQAQGVGIAQCSAWPTVH